ncbi:unnamed protein product [Arctogadus glacialis]
MKELACQLQNGAAVPWLGPVRPPVPTPPSRPPSPPHASQDSRVSAPCCHPARDKCRESWPGKGSNLASGNGRQKPKTPVSHLVIGKVSADIKGG